MMKLTCWFGVAAWAVMATATAAEFPFEFKTLTAEETFKFRGGYGTTTQLKLARPDSLKKEPKAVSSTPLYGQLGESTNQGAFLFRLDESKGDGKGYDHLILDLNQNGDLTDDPVITSASTNAPTQRLPAGRETRQFGPIVMPAGKVPGPWRPLYFADLFLSNREFRAARKNPWSYLGYLRFKAGWYLEATVAFDGVPRRLAVYDADSSTRLGDAWRPQTYRAGEEWYFRPGDSLLFDADNSGTYDADGFNHESVPFSPILYLGTNAYKVALVPDGKAIRVERWSEPLAEVWLWPNGDQVHTLSLAWENPDGEWQLITPAVAGGKTKVPPGNWRLYACSLLAKAKDGDRLLVGGWNRSLKKTFLLQAGKTNALVCGAPLDVRVTANLAQDGSVGTVSRSGFWGLVDRMVAGVKSWGSSPVLRINADILGSGGEVYSSFLKGTEQKMPPRPVFKVTMKDGKQVASGNLEFG